MSNIHDELKKIGQLEDKIENGFDQFFEIVDTQSQEIELLTKKCFGQKKTIENQQEEISELKKQIKEQQEEIEEMGEQIKQLVEEMGEQINQLVEIVDIQTQEIEEQNLVQCFTQEIEDLKRRLNENKCKDKPDKS